MARAWKVVPATAAVAAAALSLGGCAQNRFSSSSSLSDRDCLARVMYFESNRSSPDGMLAVGTVVMNRVQAPEYPKAVCEVVGQRNQFADGALNKPAGGRSLALAYGVADRVLAGERHDEVGGAKFFHTAGYTFPYRNMAYVAAAGGNVFYEKRPAGTFDRIHPATLIARADPASPSRPTRMAAAEVEDEDEAPRPARRSRPERSSRGDSQPIVLASSTLPPSRPGRQRASLTDLIESDLGQAGPLSPSVARRPAEPPRRVRASADED